MALVLTILISSHHATLRSLYSGALLGCHPPIVMISYSDELTILCTMSLSRWRQINSESFCSPLLYLIVDNLGVSAIFSCKSLNDQETQSDANIEFRKSKHLILQTQLRYGCIHSTFIAAQKGIVNQLNIICYCKILQCNILARCPKSIWDIYIPISPYPHIIHINYFKLK